MSIANQKTENIAININSHFEVILILLVLLMLMMIC